MPVKSPSGSLCPYSFMGGELHPLKYGSCLSDRQKLLQRMKAEEEFILKQPGSHYRRIWIDLYETRLDGSAVRALVRHVRAIEHTVCRLCFVGCPRIGAWRIRRQLRKLHSSIAESARFFSDPEEAKIWLVGKAV